MRYIGKKILVTGASSGLGKMIAKQYAKEGGKIINISRDKNWCASLCKSYED